MIAIRKGIFHLRSSRVSLARCTPPIPPTPSGPTISYDPSFESDASIIIAGMIGSEPPREIEPWLALRNPLLVCIRNRKRRLDTKMNPAKTANPRVSQCNLGWRAQPTSSPLPVRGEVFCLDPPLYGTWLSYKWISGVHAATWSFTILLNQGS